jgi:hypothetical protein
MNKVEPIFETEDGSFDPGEFAALWGCDPCYDREPRMPGDGYLFYNFAVEKDDPEFLRKFIPALERTIEGSTDDIENLQEFLQYAKDLLIDAEGKVNEKETVV